MRLPNCIYVLALGDLCLANTECDSQIDRKTIVRRFNPSRNQSSDITPLQVGNGIFAFGVDVTGLQTFKPYGTLTSWGWHNFSLPTTVNQTSVEDFTGLDWYTHGRLVNYDQPNPAEKDISNWLIQNPQRVNLGTIGFSFNGENVTEDMCQGNSQTLDLWTGKITSHFTYLGHQVSVETWASPDSDTVAFSVESDLLADGTLGIFFDYPLPTRNKFDAPFVGVFNATSSHATQSESQVTRATIRHDLDATTYYTSVLWDGQANMSGPLPGSHRYTLQPQSGVNKLQVSVTYSPQTDPDVPSLDDIMSFSMNWWEDYWTSGAFVDLSATTSENATELQRRIILSQYLVAVNSASTNPPQESGLVNNGWYGKFHLEMPLWHSLHFGLWNHWSLLRRSMPNMYHRFLQSSYDRAAAQGYEGARWGKMTDPTGRSAPGEINSLLIWQQPHAMYFAETEYRSFPNNETLASWDAILEATADFMASYAFYNESTRVYDLGPPMYPVSENTNPNATINPAFELAYWRFGLDIAISWKQRQGLAVPSQWQHVRDNLAPLPLSADGAAFAVYEGIPDMWRANSTTVQDHPALAGILGVLPAPRSGPPLDMAVVRETHDRIAALWDIGDCWGWDFSMLAMNSLRLGEPGEAADWLLHPLFGFDDAGYPLGGVRVATPYFPGSGGLLWAVAMMAAGWDGAEGGHWPEGWTVRSEGFTPLF